MPGVVEVNVTHPTNGEISPVRAKVYVSVGGVLKYKANMDCLSLTQQTGIVPGTATIRTASGADATAPQTLSQGLTDPKLGARIVVKVGKVTVFLGQLMYRTDQGMTDEVRYTAVDDRFFLSKIPVRGCLVRDTGLIGGNGDMKYIAGYINRCNPGGRWNCVGTDLGGTIYPVFSQMAVLGKTYESPDEAFTGPLEAGKITAWTPRRYLMYLNLIANLGSDGNAWWIKGIRKQHWRSISQSGEPDQENTRRLVWDLATVTGMKGVDPMQGNQPDPLDRKLPDMTFQGGMLGGAIKKCLTAAGTHVLKLDLTQKDGDSDSPQDVRSSRIAFAPVGYSGAGTKTKELILATSGAASANPKTVYDFQVHEDATQCASGVLVEGDRPILETSLIYEGISNTDTLKPGWTAAEETLFLTMIKGAIDPEPTAYGLLAKMPEKQGDLDPDNLVLANGSGQRPLVEGRTAEAVRLARMVLPNVFRAFYIDSGNLDTELHGVDGIYSDESDFPILKGETNKNKSYRPILPTQEQFVSTSLAAADEEASRMLTKYPIRIRVKETGGNWQESLYTNGLRVTPDGMIWLDGIGENIDAQEACIYEGALINNADVLSVSLKDIKINCAMPMDHRLAGYAESAVPDLDADYLNRAINGKPMLYVDSQGAYKEIHQVDSEPASTLEFKAPVENDSDKMITAPLTRYLPPGSEKKHAQYAAERKLAYTQHVVRKSSWRFPGIRLDYRPGEWIDKVSKRDASDETGVYVIYAPIESVKMDFEAGKTIIGGIVSEIT